MLIFTTVAQSNAYQKSTPVLTEPKKKAVWGAKSPILLFQILLIPQQAQALP